LTRPALYHYVANKDELLARLVTESAAEPAAELHEINSRADLDPVQRLREMATHIALNQTRAPERFRLMIRSEAELPEELSALYLESRRNVLHEFVTVIDEGVMAGELRPTDSRVAALGIIGMVNWIAWWHHPGSAEADQAIASQLASMAVSALVQQDDRRPESHGLAGAVELLRQDLAYLERLVEDAG